MDDLLAMIRAGDRAALARAVTLVESRRPDHRAAAARLIERVMPHSGASIRVGITGPPGVGKSTLIETLGARLLADGRRLAVLAIDPSSVRSGGSILGDKTRMAELAAHPAAFVRPSPTSGTLGGVTGHTREAILLCEAAGFDVVIVETVGTGQSEAAVAEMVDAFIVLVLPGSGDELQGLKKGVLELADIVVVNKADGDNTARAGTAAADLRAAFRIVSGSGGKRPPVLTVSARTDDGLDRLWAEIMTFWGKAQSTGSAASRRSQQSLAWFRELLTTRIHEEFFAAQSRNQAAELEAEIAAGRTTPPAAVEAMLRTLRS